MAVWWQSLVRREVQKAKDPWTGSPCVTTRTQLLQNRRAEALPDPSFDLDRDGHVGNMDLFVSKRFDLDKDGKLNDHREKKRRRGIEKRISE